MTTHRWAGLVLLVCFAIGCRDRHAPTPEERKLTPTSTDDVTAPLVDDDFRFRLAWPGEGWKVLREPDARRLRRGAVAALMYRDMSMLVIVQPVPGLEREGFTHGVIENLPLVDKHSAIEVRNVDGVEESRIVVTGTLEGRTVAVHGRIFAYQGHGYQVMATLVGDTPPALAEQALAAFSLTHGPVSGRNTATANRDLDGAGWRLRGTRLEHGPAGLRIEVPADWQVITETDLALLDRGAALGLSAPRDGMYLTVTSEPAHGATSATYLAARRTALDAAWGFEGDPVTMTAGPLPIQMRRAEVDLGYPAESWWGAVVTHDRGYQFTLWYPRPIAERLRPRVPALLAAFEFLDEPTTAALVTELATAPDHHLAIGEDFVLRGGVYQDFAHGYRWHKPSGLWRISVGDQARALAPSSRLYAEDLVGGSVTQVTVEPWARTLADYEASLRATMTSPVISHGATTVHGRDARYLEWRIDSDGAPLRMRSTLVVVGGRAVQLGTSAATNVWPSAARLAEIVGGLEVVDALPAYESGPPYRDHRFGFTMTVPAGWAAVDRDAQTSQESVTRRWTHGTDELWVMAMHTPNSDDDLKMQIAEQTMMHLRGASVPTRETLTLFGLPATRLRWDQAPGLTELLIVRRGDVMYTVLAIGTDNGSAITAGRAALSLLE